MKNRKGQPILKPQTSRLKRFGLALLGFSFLLLPIQPCHGGIEGGSLSVTVDSFAHTDPVLGEVYNVTVDWSYIFQSTLVGSDVGVVTVDSAHSGVFDPMHAPIFDWPGLFNPPSLFGSGVAPPGGYAKLNMTGPERLERSGEFQAEMPRYGFLNGAKTEVKFLYFATAGADLNYALHAREPLNLGLIAYAPISWFPAPTFTVTPRSGDNGSIDPDSSQTVNSGSDVLFGATPNEGFVVDEWKVNDVVVQTGGIVYELKDVKADVLVAVTFKQPNRTTLDFAFGSGGKVITDVSGSDDIINSVAMQNDGKIVVAGASGLDGDADFIVARYNSDGTLDTSFNRTGIVTTDFDNGDDHASAVAVQKDGKLVVAGTSTHGDTSVIAVARYEEDGSLDREFNGTGKVTTGSGGGYASAGGLALQADGKILVAGSIAGDFAVVRYKPDGSLDLSFNDIGYVTSDLGASEGANAIVVQEDGKIVVAGNTGGFFGFVGCAATRYSENGKLDVTFGVDGVATPLVSNVIQTGESLALQADGKIVVAGESSSDIYHYSSNFFAARFLADGKPDTSFGNKGATANGTVFGVGRAVVVDNKGGIVMGGSADAPGEEFHDGFALARFRSTGLPDASFDDNGEIRTEVGGIQDTAMALIIQADGKVVLAGSSFNGNDRDLALIRYEAALSQGQLVNISTRVAVGTEGDVLIGGFIITGDVPKKVIVRAIGPSLNVGGVPLAGALQDTVLELHDATGLIQSNDNWQSDQKTAIETSGLPPTDPKESAIVATLEPGNYTAIVHGKGSATGVALVEVYDLEAASGSQLANVSTRGKVETGDNAMIGGVIVGGDTPADVLVRAIGPSLTGKGVAGALQDTTLELHSSNGDLLASNDDWQSDQKQKIIDTTVPPTDPRESAILRTLAPGAYTAVVRGKNDAFGVALVEAYVIE